MVEAPVVDVEIVSKEGTQVVAGVVGPTLIIGRANGSSVMIKHDDISRRHASVEVTAQGLVVRDLSTNGTFVDGRRVMGAQQLPFGKPIVVGPFTVRIRPPGAAGVRAVAGGMDAASRPIAVAAKSEEASVIADEALLEVIEEKPAKAAPAARSVTVGGKPAAAKAVAAPAAAKGGPAKQLSDAAAKVKAAPAQPGDLNDAERDRLKRWLRGLLLEALDLPSLRPEELQDKALAPRVLQLMDELLDEHARELPKGLDRGRLRKELADEVLGLGPLEDLLADVAVSEIMVVDRATIYIEKAGKLQMTGARFSSEDALRSAIERIVTPLGRRIDESTPMVDARLKDGSRVNAIIPPLALRGPCLTIRKFSQKKLVLEDMINFGSLDERMARFLTRSVIARRNIVVSGGTGSGKTTLLNVLSSAIPEDERIITIEDAAELRLSQPHVVSLETRPANMEGRGEYSIRDLVRNALRMRPDRIVVGECRGGEALDMLQAMNTGHDGSLTTTHANSPEEAVARLETLVLMAGVDLPTRAIREQIAGSIHLVVQQARFVDGSRKITSIAEVVGIEDDGQVRLENIFEFHRLPSHRGEVLGEYRATGYMPSFLNDFITMGLCPDGNFLVSPVVFLAIGLAAGAVGAFVAVVYGWNPAMELAAGKWREYEGWANGKLRSLYSPLRAREFAIRHTLFIVGGLGLGIFLGSLFFGVVLAILGGYLPVMWIERQETQRKRALEDQLDATLQSLANTILVTQNLEDAFATIATHFDPPISQEADVLVKQVRLGTPMDEALRQLAGRCRSRNVDAIVTALTVGRQTGGELPKVLETTAGVLRETMRVEGVMEAKTSEGKAQVVVMGLLPFLFGGALQVIDPEWMAPLFHDPLGWGVLSFAMLLEVVGVIMVRKLSTIDV